MIEIGVNFAWEPSWWSFGFAKVDLDIEDRVGWCMALRLLCFGIDFTWNVDRGDSDD